MRRTANTRSVLIKLAVALPQGSKERRDLLARINVPSGWTVEEDGRANYTATAGHYKWIKVDLIRFQGDTRWLVGIQWNRKDYKSWEGTASGWPNISEAVDAAETALKARTNVLDSFRAGIRRLRPPAIKSYDLESSGG